MVSFLGLVAAVASAVHAAGDVDLGYSTVSPFLQGNGISVYRNIRYAAAPLGDLRWAKPAPPIQESGINNGSVGHSCLQAFPANQGGSYNVLATESEDCLMLNVYVPQGVTNNASVMVWFYGGGFVSGDSHLYSGDLFSGDNIIFVSANYRLGAFGWMAGSSYVSQGGVPNLGLYDQRAVFDWVQQYISRFGGDPKRVTAAGQSAGAASILHHLTAGGGTIRPNFTQAMIESPAYQPIFQADVMENTFQAFAKLAGCDDATLSCLRGLSSSVLDAANKKQVGAATPLGTFVYGPVVDGTYVPSDPPALLTANRAIAMPMLLSSTARESAPFTDPRVQTQQQFETIVGQLLPGVSQNALTQGAAIYPSPPTSLYTSQYDRLRILIQDVSFVCQVRALAKFNPSQAYTWQFNVGSAVHTSDLFYIFTGLAALAGITPDAGIAQSIQNQVRSFVSTGDAGFARYDSDGAGAVRQFNDTNTGIVQDPNNNNRCDFWASAPYDASAASVSRLPAPALVISSATASTSTPTGTARATSSLTARTFATASNAAGSTPTTAANASNTANATVARSGATSIRPHLIAATIVAGLVFVLL